MNNTGANTARKYEIQWQCAALYVAEMIVNEHSEITGVICENEDDFELEINNKTRRVFQVTHVDNQKPFGIKDDKIKKTLKNFYNIYLHNTNIDTFVLLSNSSLRGIDEDEFLFNNIIKTSDRNFYENYLDTNPNTLTDLLKKTCFRKINLDLLEEKITFLLGKRFNISHNISMEIGRKINQITRAASTSIGIQEKEYKKFSSFGNLESNDDIRGLKDKRITRESLMKTITHEFGDLFSDKDKLSLILDRGDLIKKGLFVYDVYSFNNIQSQPNTLCWERAYFKFPDIINNLDVKRKIVDEIISSIQVNKGTLILGEPYSGKSTILRRLIIELKKEYSILFLEKPIETTLSSLLAVFAQVNREFSNKILMIIDNFYDRNALEFIKFFNEVGLKNIKFLFSAQTNRLMSLSKSGNHEELSEMEIFFKDINIISIKLDEGDCLKFYDKIKEIYNKHTILIRDCKELLTHARGDLHTLIGILIGNILSYNSNQPSKFSYMDYAEKDFKENLKKLYDNNLEDIGVLCILLNSVGLNLIDKTLNVINKDMPKIDRLLELGILIEKDDGVIGIKHELWGYNLINYIIKQNYNNHISQFLERYAIKEYFKKVTDTLDLNELIITIRRISSIFIEGFILGKDLIKFIDIHRFTDEEKSKILNFGFGYSYAEIGEIQNAIDSYKESIRLNSKNFDSYNNFANLLETLNKISDALTLYDEAIKNGANIPEIYYNSGRLRQGSDPEEALNHLYRSIELDENYSYSYSVAGNLLLNKKLIEDSEMFYKVALDIDENDEVAWIGLGNIIREEIRRSHHHEAIPWNFRNGEKQKFVDMIAFYKNGYKKDTDIINTLNTWMNLGYAYHVFGYFDDSMVWMDKVLENTSMNQSDAQRIRLPIMILRLEALKIQYTNYIFKRKPRELLRDILHQMLQVDENDSETLELWSKFKKSYPENE